MIDLDALDPDLRGHLTGPVLAAEPVDPQALNRLDDKHHLPACAAWPVAKQAVLVGLWRRIAFDDGGLFGTPQFDDPTLDCCVTALAPRPRHVIGARGFAQHRITPVHICTLLGAPELAGQVTADLEAARTELAQLRTRIPDVLVGPRPTPPPGVMPITLHTWKAARDWHLSRFNNDAGILLLAVGATADRVWLYGMAGLSTLEALQIELDGPDPGVLTRLEALAALRDTGGHP